MARIHVILLFALVSLAGCVKSPGEFYPDTSEAPVLEFFWGPPDINLSQIVRTTPYGVWEGWFEADEGILYEPANEMQFYVASEKMPVRAVAPGIAISITRDYQGGSGFLTVLYGRNYSITYHHVIEIPDSLKEMDRIELGDTLGYTEMRPNEGIMEAWWEIALNARRGDVYRTLPPFEYFSEESQEKLQAIIDATWYGDETEWTVTEGCSWIKYVGKEWWTSSSRLGDFFGSGETTDDFLREKGLDWKEGDRYGRILGPTDSCGRF